MFLERYGKIFFSQMRPAFFFSLLLLPIFLSAAYLIFQQMELQHLTADFASTANKGRSAVEKKRRKERFLNRYLHANPYFINQHIESLTFLQKEKAELKRLIEHPAISNKSALKERLAFLSGEENRLVFAEENVHTSAKLKESHEKQRHRIQIDETDLQTLLTLIEDISTDPLRKAPQLIVRNFQLKTKETSLHNEVFEIEMELLKREYLE